MLARYIYCRPVSVSLCHKPALHPIGWTDQAGFYHRGFLQHVLHCVVREFGYGTSIVATCCQLISTKVEAQYYKLDYRRSNWSCTLILLVYRRPTIATIVVRYARAVWMQHFATVDRRPHWASTSVCSTMRVKQRVARVHLRQLVLVHCGTGSSEPNELSLHLLLFVGGWETDVLNTAFASSAGRTCCLATPPHVACMLAHKALRLSAVCF